MYKVVIDKTTYENIPWPSVYRLVEDEFKIKKQKKKFRAYLNVAELTQQLIDDGACWQPLDHINVTLARSTN